MSTRGQGTFLPGWLPKLDAIGRITAYKALPKGAGFEVTVEVPTGDATHPLTVRVPKRFEAINRYAYALKRVAEVLQGDLPPPQRRLYPDAD